LSNAQTTARGTDLVLARTLRVGNAVSDQALEADQLARDAAQAALLQAKAMVRAAQDERRSAASRVSQAEGSLVSSKSIDAQIARARAHLELTRARLRAAQADVELAKLQLSHTTVTAPEDGVVSKLKVRPGQIINPSQPLAELVPHRTYVVANFKEIQIGRMRPGDRAEIVLDAYSNQTFHGQIESLSGGTTARFSILPPDNASGNFVKVVQRVPVRIAWKATPKVPLFVGLSAEVTVEVGDR
jgi:membrane fusion protein (multidrug efflux system)